MSIFGTAKGEEPIYTSISGDEMLAIVKEQGFVPEMTSDSDGDPVIKFQIEGMKCSIFFYDGKDGRYESIQFFTGFTDKVPYPKVNEWTRKRRFSRAYLDAKETINLEFDVPLSGGVRKEFLVEALRRWRRTFVSFVQFAWE